jgi:hypothetical protein
MTNKATPPAPPSPIVVYARIIESYMIEYCATYSGCAVESYIQSYSPEFLRLSCPDALDLPAAFIANETDHETFVGIHINEEFSQILLAHPTLSSLLASREGLNAFLLLAEEISHFQHYVISAETDEKLSRFDLELQAEVDKIVIGALAMMDTFGRSHINELIHLLFNDSVIHGTMTDYVLVSKLAEKFWKKNIHQLGTNIIFDSRFRRLIQQASRKNGVEKIRLLDTTILAA